jgi:hypothetical protein
MRMKSSVGFAKTPSSAFNSPFSTIFPPLLANPFVGTKFIAAASILFSLALTLLTFILFSCILILFKRVYLPSERMFL